MATFFFSYARRDASPWLVTFFEHLRDEVASLMALEPAEAAFQDVVMDDGADWSATLGAAVGSADVFVPVYSPHYFRRDMCGREWHAFSRRSSGTAKGVVPVWWVPVGDDEIPAVARDLQDHRARHGPHLTRSGLLVYARNKEFDGPYWTIVRDLAESIKKAAATPPPPVSVPDLRAEPTAFPLVPIASPAGAPPASPARASRRATFVVAAENSAAMTAVRADTGMYGRDFRDWRPYHPQSEDEVALILQAVAGAEQMIGVPASADTLMRLLEEAERNHEPLILIVDPWVGALPAYERIIRDFNGRNTAHAAVIMPPGGSGADEAERRTRGLLSTWVVNGSWFREGPGTAEEFSLELRRLLVEVKGQILKVVQLSSLPPGPRSKPVLGGPGS